MARTRSIEEIRNTLAEYEAFLKEKSANLRNDIYITEIMEIWNNADSEPGQRDFVTAIYQAYALGFMTAYRRKK